MISEQKTIQSLHPHPERTPMVSIILPVHNGEAYIDESIQSLLHQTFADFEVIILDDASTDNTVARIQAYEDKRIRLILLGESDGRVKLHNDSHSRSQLHNVLNYGMGLGTGKYLARMDADDVCMPYRLERQVAFMEEHPDTTVCGSSAYILGTDELRICPVEHEDVRASLLFYNDLIHDSIMIRRADWMEHGFQYPSQYDYAEDYGLWVTMIEQVRFHILPDPLIYYRRHDQQVSTAYHRIQWASGTRLQGEMLHRFGLSFTEEELHVHTNGRDFAGDPLLRTWCNKVLQHNLEVKMYNQAALERIVGPLVDPVLT